MAETKVSPSPSPYLYSESVFLFDLPSLKSYNAITTNPPSDKTTAKHLPTLNLSLIATGTIQEMPRIYTHIGEVLERMTDEVIEAKASP